MCVCRVWFPGFSRLPPWGATGMFVDPRCASLSVFSKVRSCLSSGFSWGGWLRNFCLGAWLSLGGSPWGSPPKNFAGTPPENVEISPLVRFVGHFFAFGPDRGWGSGQKFLPGPSKEKSSSGGNSGKSFYPDP